MTVKGCVLGKNFIKEDNLKKNFTKSIYIKNLSEIDEGIKEFKEFFYINNKKDWKDFIVKPEFLKVQFDERFICKLANFLKGQTSYEVEKLPYDMVKELYFAYYPFIEEETEELFKDSFFEFFKILFKNENIDNIIEKHENPKVWNEVIKYFVYYGLYKSIKDNGIEQDASLWESYIREISGRQFYLKDNVKTNIDETIYPMIAFLIRESPRFFDEIYNYLIKAFDLARLKYTSKLQMLEPIYKAIEEKGILIEDLNLKNEINRKEILFLMNNIRKLYSLEEESDRKKIKEFFESEIFNKHKLDEEFLNKHLLKFAVLDASLFSKIFLEEYKRVYDKLYLETSTEAGKVVYDILMENFNNSNSHIGSNYVEILCEKEEWIKKYFFEEGFNKVWKSSNKAGMRGIYRGILSNHFESFINKRNYEWNLLDDGHLYVLKRNNIYEFIYDKVEEKVTLYSKEYLNLLKELLDLYMNKYFCTLSEKEKWKTLKEKAESIV